jgi:hypothetical protein
MLVGSVATGARILASAWLVALLLALADVVAAALADELLLELLLELLHAAASRHAMGIRAISTRRRVCISPPLAFRNLARILCINLADATITLRPACRARTCRCAHEG